MRLLTTHEQLAASKRQSETLPDELQPFALAIVHDAASAHILHKALGDLLAAIHSMPGIPNSELCKAMCSARETLKD